MASTDTASIPPIVVFHYPMSPWSRKLLAYLALRNIPYKSCEQPTILPRPDLAALDIKYRRMPIVAVGRDVYCDTALAMHKLDKFIPGSTLQPTTPEGRALQVMFQRFVEATLFVATVRTIPPDFAPLFGNEPFCRDRSEFIGEEFSAETQRKLRPQCLATVRGTMELLEGGLLADGRPWLLTVQDPTYADVHLAWVFAFSGVYQGDLAREGGKFPKVWAWVERFEKLVEQGKQKTEVQSVDGEEAKRILLGSDYAESDVGMDKSDATELKKGDLVESGPLDFGAAHKDKGVLVGLTGLETVIQTEIGTRIHHPRFSFAVRLVE